MRRLKTIKAKYIEHRWHSEKDSLQHLLQPDTCTQTRIKPTENNMTMNYDYEISLFGHRRKKTNTTVS